MARLLYKPVRKFLQNRTARVGEQLISVKEELAKAEEIKQLYEQKISDIELERDKMLAEAQRQAEDQCEQLLDEAGKEAQALIAAAHYEIAQEKERMQTEMKQIIIEVSAAMAEKFVSISIDEANHDLLFAQAIDELEDIAWRE
jgi:F-type H+-transporting ATPase subunit b